MKADPVAQQALLEVQQLDTTTAQLRHRAGNLPELAKLADVETHLGSARDLVVATETALGDLDREQRRVDADVEVVESRRTKNQKRLDDGLVNTPRELESLQAEIASLDRRRASLEDDELDIMMRREALDAELAEARGQRAALEEEADELGRAVTAANAEVEVEISRLAARREQAAMKVPADLMALYEKLRAGRGGVGAAEIKQGRCEGCQMPLTPSDRDRFRSAPPDEVLRCEECERILVRTAESGLM